MHADGLLKIPGLLEQNDGSISRGRRMLEQDPQVARDQGLASTWPGKGDQAFNIPLGRYQIFIPQIRL